MGGRSNHGVASGQIAVGTRISSRLDRAPALYGPLSLISIEVCKETMIRAMSQLTFTAKLPGVRPRVSVLRERREQRRCGDLRQQKPSG